MAQTAMPDAAMQRYHRAANQIRPDERSYCSAWAVSDILVTSTPSSLAIFRCISELTRAEALEVLACLSLRECEGVSAAVRISATLRSSSFGWETLSKLIQLEWSSRDLALLAITFGSRARYSRDWSSCVKSGLEGSDEAKVTMAALLETNTINFRRDCLEIKGAPVTNWESQTPYAQDPSLGRELAWCFFAAQCQMAVEASLNCTCAAAVNGDYNELEQNWLQPAEPGNTVLNKEYFRMFGVLMRKRSNEHSEYQSMQDIRQPEFAFTKSVRHAFYQFACASSSCIPILLEGPHGCGKSAVVSRLANITNTGVNSSTISSDNVCFVHMDTASNKDDSNDFFSLVGCVVPLPDGGGFRWRFGPIGHAIVNGQWLVLESMDCDNRVGNSHTSALISRLANLRPGDEFQVPSRSEPLRVGLGFRLIATRTVKVTGSDGSKQWTPPGGWDAWQRISLPSFSQEEQSSILNHRFPSITDCVPRVLRAISGVSAKILQRRRALDREPTLREAVRICQRLTQARKDAPQEFSPELALLETLDSLVLWASDDGLRQDLIAICSEAWSVPAHVGDVLLSERNPPVVNSRETVRIGRFRSLKNSEEAAASGRRKLAMTKHTARTLERIARCVSVGESVLLNGETGTGKTATLQELARLLNKKLVVVNMSRQSDIGDLIGGFRPFEMAAVLPELVKRFEEAFCKHLSSKKNARFLDALHKSARSQRQSGRALRLMHGAMQAIPASVRNSNSDAALEWSRIEKMIAKLEKLMPSMDAAWIGNAKSRADEQGPNPPPRKRLRSSPQAGNNSVLAKDTEDTGREESTGERKNKNRQINFEYSDGALVSALRAGHWVLLDEINLAPVEVLDYLVSLLDHGSLTIPNEEGETVHAAKGFALFAAMNPPTDFGKRPLSKEIRSRVTEFYIEDIDNKEDIALLVSQRLFGVDFSEQQARRLSTGEARLAQDIAEFYLAVRRLAKDGTVDDASGKCARFSLRTLSIMLSHAASVSKHMTSNVQGERRAAFEGAILAFATPLPRSGRPFVEKLALQYLLHETHPNKKRKKGLSKQMRLPQGSSSCVVAGFPIETLKSSKVNINESLNFVVTAAVTETLVDVCRALTYGVTRVPILLQGPTSAGKTSLVSYLASLTGNQLIRINNHEHTDLAEYLGCYVADDRGSLVFREGPLVRAVREGLWVVLDELNLAPPEVLESLNRLLDDNKEIRIPETGEVVKAHKNFTLFATQNPPGIYGGRKELSRAFRGRFIEIQVDELPDVDLIEIIERRCELPKSFAIKMVAVMRELQTRRRVSRLFSGKSGFVTARDLFRWGARRPLSREDLAVHGFFLLGERARNIAERGIVRDVLIAKIGVDASVLNDSILYGHLLNPSYPIEVNLPGCTTSDSNAFKELLAKSMSELQIANTPHMARMISLLLHCASNNEPALLVGPTGSGKTSACSLIARIMKSELLSVNCHRHTESSDLVGGFRPGRKSDDNAPLFVWTDGPLVQAMRNGDSFLMDEVNMADDAVVERLNAVLEPGRTLMLSEKGSDSDTVVGHSSFRIFATMNPGGDFGKKELSPALRNRFTEVWIPSASALEDFLPVVQSRIVMSEDERTNLQLKTAQEALRRFLSRMSEAQHSDSLFASSNFGLKNQVMSLRDITAWSNFIQQATIKCGLHAMLAFAHGARLVFLDGLSVGANAVFGKESEAELWSKVLEEVPDCLRDEAKKARFDCGTTEISRTENGLQIGPFCLESALDRRPSHLLEHSFSMAAPSTLRNVGRVVRAMAVDSRPILLEGPPGAGKTSLICALARSANMQLSRINLSESTEMSDLIGGDIPGPATGQFCFRRGELLRAIEGGSWVLLDEMNLASQSVLEGLNSLLDHRRSVFIPELASEIVAHKNFRIFAAQNPAREGCGRRGLPQSFLNRFTKVSVEAPSNNDLVLIAAATHPKLEKQQIEKVVRTLSLLKEHFANMTGGGKTAEFGLRQVLRWCQLLDVGGRVAPDAELCFDVIVLQGLMNNAERDAARKIFCLVFDRSGSILPKTPSLRLVDSSHVRFGWSVVRQGSHLNFSSLGGFNPSVSTARTRCLQALAIVVNAGWPCIITSDSGIVSSSESVCAVESFAALSGQKLLKLKGGSFLDADDLLGGYTQQDTQGELCRLKMHFLSIYGEILNTGFATQSLSWVRQQSFHDLEVSASRIFSMQTDFEPSEHGQSQMKGVVNLLRKSVALLSSFVGDDCTVQQLDTISADIEKLSNRIAHPDEKVPPTFCWERSELVRAIERGDWVLLEDADQCSPSILDRLNPLLELSAHPPSSAVSAEKGLTSEPVLLPEAPPNPDGSPAVISAHPNFRLFLIADDANGTRLSRAIIDRSITLKLGEEKSSVEEMRDALVGSMRLSQRCFACKSRLAEISPLGANESLVPSSLPLKGKCQESPELRAVASVVCTGISDFCLMYEQSLRSRDVYLLHLAFRVQSEVPDLKALENISLSPSWSIADPVPQFGNWFKPDERRLRPELTVSFESFVVSALSQLFLLGCTSKDDFLNRRLLLSSVCTSSIGVLANCPADSRHMPSEHRWDLCFDPLYGLDSACPFAVNQFHVTKNQLANAICFRFDVLVISRFLQSWKDACSESENISFGAEATTLFTTSKKQSHVPVQEMRSRDPVIFLGNVAYRVALLLVNIAHSFRSAVAARAELLEGWILPNESTWLQLFGVAQRFIDFLRRPCNSADRIAYSMVLLRQICKACSVVGSGNVVINGSDLQLMLQEVQTLCGQRANYELFKPALPIPRTEDGLRIERDLMTLTLNGVCARLCTARQSVSKALVSLSTPVSEDDDKVALSIHRLKGLLQDSAIGPEATRSSSEEGIEFPLWKYIRSVSFENMGHALLIRLQESEMQCDVNGLYSELRRLSENALLEFSLNPVSPLSAQIAMQRMSWMFSSSVPDLKHISELIIESSISWHKVCNLNLSAELCNRSAEYLYRNSVASDPLANSLLSFYRKESDSQHSANSFPPHEVVAAACTLISGYSLAGPDASSPAWQLRIHHLFNSLYSLRLLTSEVPHFQSMPKGGQNVLPSLSCARSLCEEVLGAPALQTLKNCLQVQTALRNASRLLQDNSALNNAPHALFFLVTGFLWVVTGAIRVEKACNDLEHLYGIDPSTYAMEEAKFFASRCQESAAFELACDASSFVKLGGDDLQTSVPRLRASEGKKSAFEHAIHRSSQVIHRPQEFASFSAFVSAVTRIRELLSEQSLVWKLFDIALEGSYVSGSLNFVKKQLHEGVLMLFEKSCESLEVGGELGHFRDIGGNFARGLREVQHGSLVALKGLSVAISEMNERKKLRTLSVHDLLLFPRSAFSDGRDSVEVVNRLQVNHLQGNIQAKAVRFMFLHCEAFRTHVLPAVRKCFSGIVSNWKSAQLTEESEEKVRNSLFVIKEKTRMEDMPGMGELHCLENDEEEDFAFHFGVDIAEVDQLLTGSANAEAGEDSFPTNAEKSLEVDTNSVLDVSEFWNHHSSCFLNSRKEDLATEKESENIFRSLLCALGSIVSDTLFAQNDSGICSSSIASCLLSSRISGHAEHIAEAREMGSKDPASSKTYNFYKHSNVAEVSKMKTVLRQLIHRIAAVQLHFRDDDGNHPVLNVVTDAAERALKACDITTSLGPLVSVLENVIRKADEWQRLFATKALSLADEAKLLSKLALRWRRMEVDSWPKLLNSREELAKQRAEKWFYHLYDGLIGNDDNPYDGEENLNSAVSTMDQFLRSSPQGEYETRIDMLLSISVQLESSELIGHQNLGHSIAGLCAFYRQFLPKIEDAISIAKRPLEKKMNDFARLSTWHGTESLGAATRMTKGVEKELEYFRLKARSEKVRRKLHKLCRDADAILRVPVFNEIAKQIKKNGFVDLSTELSGRIIASAQDNQNAKHPALTTILIDQEFEILSQDFTLGVGDLSLFCSSSRLSKMSTLCKRMQEISTASTCSNIFAVKQAEVSSALLRSAIRSRALDLKQSTDAGVQVKKRAFVELLRALEKIGVSPFEKPSMKKRSEPSFWLGVKSPFRDPAISQTADHLFFHVAGRVQRLRAVSDGRVRSADITPEESKKSMSFSADLFDKSILQRQSLLLAVSAMNDTKEIVAQMSDFHMAADKSPCPSLSLAKQLFDVANRVESIQKDVCFALRCAQQEVNKADTISHENVQTLASEKYSLLSIRRCLPLAKESVVVLRKANSLLVNFTSAKAVVKLLQLSRTKTHLVTQVLATSCLESLNHLRMLRDSLENELVAAERASKLSLASSTLRSVVSYIQESVSASECALQACAEPRPFTGNNTERQAAEILQKCELAVESTLRFAQTVIGKQELAGEQNSSVFGNTAEMNAEDESTVQPNILRRGHDMSIDAGKTTGVLALKNVLIEILEQVEKVDRFRSYDAEAEKLSSCLSQIQLAVRNLGNFIMCYLNSLVIPYFRSVSSFHMESLGLLKTLTALFIGIAEEGFCRPPEQEENVEDDTLPSDVDGTGFGDVGEGDASLAKDVSEEVEDEEQLLGMRNENNAPSDKKQEENDVDKDAGVEMSCDFEGDLQDMERPEQDEMNDTDGDGDEKEKVEEQFGEGRDEEAMDIDERLWNDDDEAADQGNDQADSNQGDIESGKRDLDATLTARDNSESDRPQPQKSKQSEKTRKDNEANEEPRDEHESEVEPEHGGQEVEEGAADGSNAENEERSNRRQLKLGEDEDSMSDGEFQDDMNENTPLLNEKPDDGEGADTLSGSDNEGADMDGDEAMLGTNVDGLGHDSASPEVQEGKHDSELDATVNEDLMNDLEDDCLEDDQGIPNNVNPEGLDDEMNMESDMRRDELPPEQSPIDQEHSDSNPSADQGLDADGKSPRQNIPEDKNLPNSNPLSGGTKTTPGSRNEDNMKEKALLFSNADATGASSTRNEESASGEEMGRTGEGVETGKTSTSSSNPGAVSRASDPMPKMEDFEPQSAQHDPNPFRALHEGQLGDEWEKRMNILEDLAKSQDLNADSSTKNDFPGSNASLHEFVSEAEKKQENDKSALGPATEDQHEALSKKGEESEDNAMDIGHADGIEKREELRQEHDPNQKLNSNAVPPPSEKPDLDVMDRIEAHGEVTDGTTAQAIMEHPLVTAMRLLEDMCIEKSDTTARNGDLSTKNGQESQPDKMDDESNGQDQEMVDAPVDEPASDTPPQSNFEETDFCAMWRKLERLTENDAAALCEQLRLVLDPTVRSGLAGSFKTGKRLDMKKVIDFVASDFRRDRIWLRRVRPSKRSYDVLVAIDDSESMSESGAGALALAGLVLLHSALSKLEVGRVGILKFGADCHIVRDLNESRPIDEGRGGDILSQFSFSEKKTNIQQLLVTSQGLLRQSRDATAEDDVQLIFIISDGKLSEREELRKQLRLISSENVLVAFIVVNSNVTEKSSIFSVKQVTYGEDGRVKVTPYMTDFPFQFYTVIHDVKLLPSVLGNALRQWLELMANLS